MKRTLLLSFAAALTAALGCYTGASVDMAAPGGPGTSSPTTSGLTGDLPCDVTGLLADNCVTCHGSPPAGGAPNSLVSYADLTGPSKVDPSKTMADECVTRMKDASKPMPTSGLLPASQVAILEGWIAAGMPKGTCATANTNTATVCTSNTMSRRGEGSTMSPGQACIQCHSQGEGPRFQIAGTVYPTMHEPDNCNGSPGGMTVQITDANGQVFSLKVNSAGNFSLSRASVALPYTASVTANGKTRAMNGAQTNGDCNTCHSEQGTQGAPGRIMAP